MKKRIVLVDDQRLFLESLRVVIEDSEPGLSVVGMAENGKEAVEVADRERPDIILMDVRMPEMNGVEAVRIIKQRHPGIRIIMLTTFEDDEYVRNALTYGASGYLLKNIPTGELIASIRAALSGAVSIDPRVVPGLLTGASGVSGASGAAGATGGGGLGTRDPWVDELNRKERQILGLMVQGLSNPEIAEQVCIAEQTVRNYVSRIYTKIGVSNRVQAVRRARESGRF